MNRVIRQISITAALTAGFCFLLVWGVVSFISNGGCTPNKINPATVTTLNAAKLTTVETSKAVKLDADQIDTHVSDLHKHVPASLDTYFNPFQLAVRGNTDDLRSQSGKLDKLTTDLATSSKDVQDRDKLIGTQKEEIKKLNDEKSSALRGLMMLIIAGAVICVGGSVALYCTGNYKIAVPLGGGSIACLVTALVVSQLGVWFALGGMLIMLAGLGYVAYDLIRKHEANVELHKTGVELVQSVEIAKQGLSKPRRQFKFGDHALPGSVDIVQSPGTKAFVAKVRGKQDCPPVRLASKVYKETSRS